jgi:hypothetical protein
MSEEKEKNSSATQDNEGSKTISRREFAIGSIALISGYASAESSANAADAQIKLLKSDDVREQMEDRHILDQDLIQVIQHAEKTGEKLYEPDTGMFLSKLRVKNVCFYAEYSIVKDGYRIHSAYSHRFSFAGD